MDLLDKHFWYPIGVRKVGLTRFFPGCCAPFPGWDYRPCLVGFGHSSCGLHPRPHPVISHPTPGFSEGEGLPLPLRPAVPHPLHRTHGNRLESVPVPHPPLQDLLLPEPPVPLLSVSTLTSPQHLTLDSALFLAGYQASVCGKLTGRQAATITSHDI